MDKVTDFAGGSNFVFLALLTFGLTDSISTRKILVTAAVLVWGTRLSLYLLYRILKIGHDKRFDGTRENFWAFLVFWVFQMFWVFTVSIPVMFINGTDLDDDNDDLKEEAKGPVIAGFIMFAIGLICEAVSDQQKFSFKTSSPEARSKWCAVGIWKYSRHPNYFGEILLWWGIFVMSTSYSSPRYAILFNILSPLFTCAILLFLSGIPGLEKKDGEKYGDKEEYVEYRRNTSCYGGLPDGIKKYLLFEWDMYKAEKKKMIEQEVVN